MSAGGHWGGGCVPSEHRAIQRVLQVSALAIPFCVFIPVSKKSPLLFEYSSNAEELLFISVASVLEGHWITYQEPVSASQKVKSHEIPELGFTLCYVAHIIWSISCMQEIDLQHSIVILRYPRDLILFYNFSSCLGSPPCRFNPEKMSFLCPNMLWILHRHQLDWRGLCCCEKQFWAFWVKWVLEWPLPHILSAHGLGESTFGQHWDTIPCCAELQIFTIASLCRREPGTWPRPFPKLLILCCGLQELLCLRPSRDVSSPFHHKMQASGRRNVPLCAVAWSHMMSWERWAGQRGGLVVSSRERCSS